MTTEIQSIPMLTLNGLLMNAFMGNEFVDKESGEVTPAALKVQVLSDVPQKSGDIKKEMITLSVKDELQYDIYQSFMGQMISIPVGVMGDGKSRNYFIQKGFLPVKYQQPATGSASSSKPSSSIKSPL